MVEHEELQLGSEALALRWKLESSMRSNSVPFAPVHFLALLLLLFAGGLLGGCDSSQGAATLNFQGDAKRGRTLVGNYGCGNCHLIPNVAGADGNVGPPLLHLATRVYIAGFVRNSPENMSVWLQDPQKILPGNAMPAMGISRKDAHDITAFLYSVK
jgi:cytochrome c